MRKKKILAIVGLTATGKTDIAIELAKKLNGELVAVDSRQVYVGLDLGSGKLPGQIVSYQKGDGYWIVDGIKIWLYDIADPRQQFDVMKYVDLAKEAIKKIELTGKLPILVGGTGLYFQALVSGIVDQQSSIDLEVRSELNNLSLDQLQEKLKLLSFESWDKLNDSDKSNPRRLVRAIEKSLEPDKRIKTEGLDSEYNILKIGLTAPKEKLSERINKRVENRLEMGMIEEVERLYSEGISWERMDQLGLEYGLLAQYCQQKITKERFKELLNLRINQYAKRQWVWFKRDNQINWFDITEDDWQEKMTEQVTAWYN